MIATPDSLSIDDNVLKDRAGRVVATLSKGLGLAEAFSYAHVFAASAELLRFMEIKVTESVAALEAYDTRMKQEFSKTRAYVGHTTYSNPPAWLEESILVVTMAKGERVQLNQKLIMTNLDPLLVKDNYLTNYEGKIIAVLSKDSGEDKVLAYAHLFAASVHLLDIINFLSSKELAEIEQSCKVAREFNKLSDIPPDVPVLGAPSPFIPDSLQKTLQMVAKAKGKEFRTPSFTRV